MQQLHWQYIVQLQVSVQASGHERARRRTHEATEALEGARDADAGVDLDEDALGSVNVHLQAPSFVQRRV